MKITKVSQPSIDEILKNKYDIVLCSSGYESRSSYFANKVGVIDARLVCLGHQEHKEELFRPRNDEKYADLGYELHELSGYSTNGARTFLLNALAETDSKLYRMLVDISSMTRAWYGGLVHALWTQTIIPKIVVDFVYVPAVYRKALPSYPPNEVFAPLGGFSGLAMSDTPTALIVGLGQARGRAIGIVEELDPIKTIAFYTNPSTDTRYTSDVIAANRDLFDVLGNSNIVKYPIFDSVASLSLLESVCSGLTKKFSVVMTSVGPKIFSLYCSLIATKYPEISVWRISAGTYGNVIDQAPGERIVILEVEWAAD